MPLSVPAATQGVLASLEYTVPSNVLTTSSTFVDVSASNLVVTFTAPLSGTVMVTLSAMCQGASGTFYNWNLRDSGGDIAGTSRGMSYGTSTPMRQTAAIRVTGLTPGTSYTWKWGHAITAGSGGSGLSGQAAGDLRASMQVAAAP